MYLTEAIMCFKKRMIRKKDFDEIIDKFLEVVNDEFGKIKDTIDTDEDGYVSMSEIRVVLKTELKGIKEFIGGFK